MSPVNCCGCSRPSSDERGSGALRQSAWRGGRRAFAHLRNAYPDLKFSAAEDIEAVIRRNALTALFSAAPHGVSAGIVDRLLRAAAEAGTRVHCVDISADFRYASQGAFEAVYKHPHGAPARIREFTCAVPEHLQRSPTPHVAHPGCFATATLLASVPAGSRTHGLTAVRHRHYRQHRLGRKPVDGTHHPLSTVISIAMAPLAIATFQRSRLAPNRRPVSRHNSISCRTPALSREYSRHRASQLKIRSARCRRSMRCAPIIRIARSFGGRDRAAVKDVATSNYSNLSAVTNGNSIAVMSVLDNLNKGAAGGAIQWMNRLLESQKRRDSRLPHPDGLEVLMAATNIATAHASHWPGVCPIPVEVAHGEGVWLHARDGRKILDFYGGHACRARLCAPPMAAALERQARQMAFQTNALPMVIRERAAAKLAKFAALDWKRCFGSTAAPKRTKTRSSLRSRSPAALRRWRSNKAFMAAPPRRAR